MGMDNSMDDTVVNRFDKMKSYLTLSMPCQLQLSGTLQLEPFFFFFHFSPSHSIINLTLTLGVGRAWAGSSGAGEPREAPV
jgi:hypothetical protein